MGALVAGGGWAVSGDCRWVYIHYFSFTKNSPHAHTEIPKKKYPREIANVITGKE